LFFWPEFLCIGCKLKHADRQAGGFFEDWDIFFFLESGCICRGVYLIVLGQSNPFRKVRIGAYKFIIINHQSLTNKSQIKKNKKTAV